MKKHLQNISSQRLFHSKLSDDVYTRVQDAFVSYLLCLQHTQNDDQKAFIYDYPTLLTVPYTVNQPQRSPFVHVAVLVSALVGMTNGTFR